MFDLCSELRYKCYFIIKTNNTLKLNKLHCKLAHFDNKCITNNIIGLLIELVAPEALVPHSYYVCVLPNKCFYTKNLSNKAYIFKSISS